MPTGAGIRVERVIRVELTELWRHTQDPQLHQQWDLRFTDIEYLPRDGPDDPQRFLYATRIGLGLGVTGGGESTGNRDLRNGTSVSGLRFWSDAPQSLIREGSGYWRYTPVPGAVRFETWYDYTVRWGIVGRILDRVAFRPLLAWGTAWSFDRLCLWLERGQPPRVSALLAVAAGLSQTAACGAGVSAVSAARSGRNLLPRLGIATALAASAALARRGTPAAHRCDWSWH